MSATGRPLAVITGASSGLGLDLAKLAAADGHDLLLVARSEGALNQLGGELADKHGIAAHVHVADLTDPEAVAGVADRVLTEFGGCDVLINNAGYGHNGAFLEGDLAMQLDMIRLNIMALVDLTHRLAPKMVEKRSGRVMNVASTAAFQPGPLMAVYFATKAFVLSFSEAMREELSAHGVSVTALCPGATHTGFQSKASMDDARVFKFGVMSSEAVTRIGWKALMAGRGTVVTGLYNKLLVTVVRFTPRWAVPKVTRMFTGGGAH